MTAKEKQACMDYLHGDVDKELEAACHYEYARKSRVLRFAAELKKRLIRKSDLEDSANLDDKVAYRTDKKFGESEWIINGVWPAIWQCTSYPRLAWNNLGDGEQQNISQNFSSINVPPLGMPDVTFLKRELELVEADGLVALDRAVSEKEKAPKIKPAIEKGCWLFAAFSLNFTQTKKRMRQRFEAWLDLPENKLRFTKYASDPTGKTGTFKDRLKDLAAWRLFDELGWNGLLDYTNANRKRDKTGKPLVFHDARKGQSAKVPLNEAPLFNDQAQCLNAIQRAKDYLKQIIPWEFEEQPHKHFRRGV